LAHIKQLEELEK